MMKVRTLILLFVLSLFIQNISLGIQLNEGLTLKLTLNNIEEEYNVKFNYDEALIENKTVSQSVELDGDLSEQLELILTPYDLEFKRITKRNYVIIEIESVEVVTKEPPIKTYEELNQENDIILVKGVVTSIADNSTIPGANIIVQGTSSGTVSDFNGNYQIEVDEDAILEVSFVGFKTETVSIAGRSIINIALEEDIKALEAVVVIGYGTVKKSDLTGSLSSVSGEDITKVPIVSLDQALPGRAACKSAR